PTSAHGRSSIAGADGRAETLRHEPHRESLRSGKPWGCRHSPPLAHRRQHFAATLGPMQPQDPDERLTRRRRCKEGQFVTASLTLGFTQTRPETVAAVVPTEARRFSEDSDRRRTDAGRLVRLYRLCE